MVVVVVVVATDAAAGGRDPTTLSLSITLKVQQAAQDRIIGHVINGRRGFQRMRDVRMEMGCLAGLVCQFVTSEFSWGNE